MTTDTMPASEQLAEKQIETYRDLVIAMADGRDVDDATLLRLLAGRNGDQLQGDVGLLRKRRDAANALSEVERLGSERIPELAAAKKSAQDKVAKRIKEQAVELEELRVAAERANQALDSLESEIRHDGVRNYNFLEMTSSAECELEAGNLSRMLSEARDNSRKSALSSAEQREFNKATSELAGLDHEVGRLRRAGEVAEAAVLAAKAAVVRTELAAFNDRLARHKKAADEIPSLEQHYEQARKRRFLPENLKLSEPGKKSAYELSAR